MMRQLLNQENLVPQLSKPDNFHPSGHSGWFWTDVDPILTNNFPPHMDPAAALHLLLARRHETGEGGDEGVDSRNIMRACPNL